MYAVSLDMLNNFSGKEFRVERAITSCTPMFDLVTNKYIARSRSSSHFSLLINTLTFGHSRSFDQLTPIQLRVNPQTGKVVQSLLITSISVSVSCSIHVVIETKNFIFFLKNSLQFAIRRTVCSDVLRTHAPTMEPFRPESSSVISCVALCYALLLADFDITVGVLRREGNI